MARLYTARVASLLGTLVVATALSVAVIPGVSFAVDSWGATGSGYIAATNVHTVTSSVRSLSPSSSSPATWQIQAKFPSIPFNPGLHNFQVSCVSSTFCMAVGYNSNGAVALSFNGTSWATQTLPPGIGKLSDVSCTSSTWCVAVGSPPVTQTNASGVLLVWDGHTWASQPSPVAVNQLYGVSCVSATWCVAVGDYGNPNIAAESGYLSSDYTPVAISWNGRTWTSQTINTSVNQLYSVSCVSATSCAAVGVWWGTYSSTTTKVALSWDGSAWNSVRRAAWTGKTYTQLDTPSRGIACASPVECIAVGRVSSFGKSPTGRALSWDGHTWATQTLPPDISQLNAVTCPSPTLCVAVGKWDGSATSAAGGVAVVWNGSSWSSQTLPSGTGYLAGVSCASAAFCETVGSNLNSNLVFSYAEGTWSTIATVATKHQGAPSLWRSGGG